MNKERNKGVRELAKADIRAMEGEGNERRFRISFASEEPYKRWWGIEILECDKEAVELERVNEIGVILFNHNRDKVLGKIDKAWVENERCYAEIEFDSDEESEKIYQKVKNGTLKGVSVGYNVSNWEDVEAGEKSMNGKYEGPCSIAMKWMPYEISIVSIPADYTVGVGREDEEGKEINIALYERQVIINKNKSFKGGK